MEKITCPSGYKAINKLGQGTYGVVFKAVETTTSKAVAIKRVIIDVMSEGVPSSAIREISLMKSLDHSNIIKLFDIIVEETDLFMVLELMAFNLYTLMHNYSHGALSPQIVRSYMWQILLALEYCHAKRIVHRDLKPQNLLLDKYGTIKLADFGLGRCFSIPVKPYTNQVVSLWYRPPELLLGSLYYTSAIDLWSVGCILSEMCTGVVLFRGESEIDQLFKIFALMGTVDEDNYPGVSSLPHFNAAFPRWPRSKEVFEIESLGEDGRELLQALLTYDPSTRISAKDCLKCKYFDGVEQIAPSMFGSEVNR